MLELITYAVTGRGVPVTNDAYSVWIDEGCCAEDTRAVKRAVT